MEAIEKRRLRIWDIKRQNHERESCCELWLQGVLALLSRPLKLNLAQLVTYRWDNRPQIASRLTRSMIDPATELAQIRQQKDRKNQDQVRLEVSI